MRKDMRCLLLPLIVILLIFCNLACGASEQEPATTPSSEPSQSSTPAPEPELETEPAQSIEELELKYDDGWAEEALSGGGGYIIDFTPQALPFTINKVSIVAALWGEFSEDQMYTVSIWDKDHKVLYSEERPVTEYTERMPSLVEVEIPDIEVNDRFYVHVWTGTGRLQGMHMGADDSIVNEHSHLTVKEGDEYKILDTWPFPSEKWFGDKSKVNWMIRVNGTAMVEK